jgi:signal transduction histidine kinase
MDVDFRRLFESAPDLYMVLAPDPPAFTIVAASDAYLRAVKRRRDELVGRPVFDALPVGPEDRSSLETSSASFRRVVESGRPDTMAVQRHDIVRPEAEGGDFETRYWSAVNTPVLSDDGTVLYVLHRVEDVTEFIALRQRGAEQEALTATLQTRAGEMEVEIYRRAQEIQAVNRSLRDANERLGELDRAKTEFFANVSHEFRTPLTLLLGILDEQLHGAPAERIASLQIARRSARRLLKLVNALLDFSRHEAGRAAASFSQTDVGTLTAQVASSFASACEGAALRFVIDCPPTRVPVWVDREMWERIVLNLVSNAFKFTFEGEIVVRTRDAPDGLELTVADTGVGIPAEELPRIFERFHRVASTAGRSIEGTGIGLSLVRELVRQHGGDVEVSSRPGRGSVFSVRVPAGTAHLAPDRLAHGGAAVEFVSAAQPFVDSVRACCSRTTTPTCASTSAASWRASTTLRSRVMASRRWRSRREYGRTWSSRT